MRNFLRRRVTFGFIVWLVLAQAVRSQQAPIKGLDEYILKAMRDWETPGLAIAIVKDDKVVFAKGYGVRKMGESAPVTEKTIFACASTTKAMAAACLGMLVDEGKVKWDDPVTKHLPWFQLYDPYVTRELTVRDLLCHRSGLARGDLLWYQSPHSREEVIRRVRHLKPAWSLRSRYGYQNIMYIAAGEVVEAVSGKSWDEFMKERLFTPLGMTSTTTSVKDLRKFTDVATHHVKIDDRFQPIEWPNYDNVGAAGTVNSNVVDYAHWIRLNLNDGMLNGKEILSEKVVEEMQSPQAIIPLDSTTKALWPSMHFASYGLGWTLRDYLGRKLIQHDGALDGMRARVAFVPEEKLGFVILLNSSRSPLHGAIGYRILDHYFGAPEKDWNAILLKNFRDQEEKGKAEEKKKLDARVQGTKPSLALDSYTGTYEHEMYGETKVSMEGGKLVFSFYPTYVGNVDHWNYDAFQVVWRDKKMDKDFITFTLNSDGKVELMKWEGVGDFKKAEKK
ncbi:MAG: serine hydrolase [Ignavibacteriales bacterium]|nr:serine hydrolase [Ignavibacteriales bacterium]